MERNPKLFHVLAFLWSVYIELWETITRRGEGRELGGDRCESSKRRSLQIKSTMCSSWSSLLIL